MEEELRDGRNSLSQGQVLACSSVFRLFSRNDSFEVKLKSSAASE